jgi:hypothetical protein
MLDDAISTMLDVHARLNAAIAEGSFSFSGPCPALPHFAGPSIYAILDADANGVGPSVVAAAPAADDEKKAAAKAAEKIAIEKVKESIAGLSMSSQQAAVDRPFSVSTKRNGTSVIKLNDGASYEGQLKFLVGYDQSNAAPSNLKSDPSKYCATNRELYSGQLIFVNEVKHVRTVDGKPVPWNLMSIP